MGDIHMRRHNKFFHTVIVRSGSRRNADTDAAGRYRGGYAADSGPGISMRRIFEPDNADTDGSAGGLCFGRCKLYRVVPIFMETGPEMVPVGHGHTGCCHHDRLWAFLRTEKSR